LKHNAGHPLRQFIPPGVGCRRNGHEPLTMVNNNEATQTTSCQTSFSYLNIDSCTRVFKGRLVYAKCYRIMLQPMV
jgi:hypothetical protein